MTRPRKNPGASGIWTRDLPLSERTLQPLGQRGGPRVADLGSVPALTVELLSRSSHTSGLRNGTPAATLPGACHHTVGIETGRSGVNILWLGEIASLTCSFYLSLAARTIVWADPSLRYTGKPLNVSPPHSHPLPLSLSLSFRNVDLQTEEHTQTQFYTKCLSNRYDLIEQNNLEAIPCLPFSTRTPYH